MVDGSRRPAERLERPLDPDMDPDIVRGADGLNGLDGLDGAVGDLAVVAVVAVAVVAVAALTSPGPVDWLRETFELKSSDIPE